MTRLVLWNLMSRSEEKRVGEVAFLVHNTGEDALVVIPWGRWLPGEALNTTKCCVLRWL